MAKKRVVDVQFWELDNPMSKIPSQTMEARLLGVLSSKEAAATLANFEVADKMFTKPTINMSDVITAMENLHSEKDSATYGHLVFATKQIGETESYGKRLCITGAIDLLDQTKLDKITKFIELDASLVDGTLISVKEFEKDE